MKRRTFLGFSSAAATTAANTLAPYTGSWTTAEAAHLLRRTTFGPSPAQIKQAVADGLSTTIGALFAPLEIPEPPINYRTDDAVEVPIGETWVGVALGPNPPAGVIPNRRRANRAWYISMAIEDGVHIRSKLALFWMNHFAIGPIASALYNYDYLVMLLRNSYGNFRTFVEEVTLAPCMLLFLNGQQNRRQAPNENYARELLELFTIGRGPAVGAGDYTHYTEDDVVQMARSLTGWRARTLDTGEVESYFTPNRHDEEDKQLSHRFDNVVVTNADDEEYKVIIDIILQKAETARYICRQLHTWFVGAQIDDVVEANIIEPMAQMMLDNDYDIQPALEALLQSEYFFMGEHRGCMISNPMDYLLRIVNSFSMQTESPTIINKYYFWDRMHQFSNQLGMYLLELPSVAGWPAYYQAPSFDEQWINSVTLPIRQEITINIMNDIFQDGKRWEVDLLGYIAELDNNLEPTAMIDEIASYLFAAPLSDNQRDFLKEVLIPGLPDFEWTVEYSDYLQDPDNTQLRNAVLNKLTALFDTLTKMPEFQLI